MRFFCWRRIFIYIYALWVIVFMVWGFFSAGGLVHKLGYALLPAMPWAWFFAYLPLASLSANTFFIVELIVGYSLNLSILYLLGSALDKMRERIDGRNIKS